MQTAIDKQATGLAAALATLEDSLETPVISGELADWCQRVWAAYETVHAMYVERVRIAHERQLVEIGRQDQEMSAVVAQLADEDQALLIELERLGSLLHVFVDRLDPQAEGAHEPSSDEDGSSDEERRSLVQDMLALVIRIRTLEKGIQTSYFEAFQRDRGVGD
jgi:hypothetical protein